MAWQFNEGRVFPAGCAIGDSNSTQLLPAGTIVRATDQAASNNQGEGEFIYLQGVAGLTAGELVQYNAGTGAVARQAGTQRTGQPLAVSMGAFTSGWAFYQIGGNALIKKATGQFSPNVAVYLSTTTGQISSTPTSGRQVLGARYNGAATVSSGTATIVITIDRPHAQSQLI